MAFLFDLTQYVDGETVEEDEDINSPQSQVIQKENYGVCTKGNWLWIGGVQGESTDPGSALEEAISKLKCRYALFSIIIEETLALIILNAALLTLLLSLQRFWNRTTIQ